VKSLILVSCVLLISLLSAIAVNPAALSNGSYQKTDERPSTKAKIRSKPAPPYPREAEEQRIEATIVLRAIFRATGKVTDIEFAKVIPSNVPEAIVQKLTDESIKAAGKIKFDPATKDGHPVSMYVQLEYNFRP
jgi:outer membrane biosynthesis protein TonB